ncbi:Asp-tRNA(Asn)/Glu-tRNA(Gln) amidotransferase subunit GatA [Mycoplasmoides alvi]|uniref:Asp-tRNA(Asn)/Glu-tRNA(Gln) amidotransferase subunit GatA n=1 Tax=Mycoplasmoides alvi TaxID=78580 RepID=UPI00051AAEEE|nr:Asp-tRNA(Asn)/Glu-tRNA(Gln) amidotransferase subunit GatA [Mycoplasmoides alvi]
MQSKIIDLHQKLKSNNLSASKLIKKSLNLCKKFKKTNFMININHVESLRLAKHLHSEEYFSKSLLTCIPYVLKDNISTKDIITTGGSKFLETYLPPYDATVYRLLKQSNSILIGKSNLDEFGLGGTGSFSAYGIVSNPFEPKHIAGGSSSGCAVAVASGTVPFAIGTDTGDSIRRPASFCGVVGYKPTYGLISRYGVFPYAPSLDHVGIFASTVADIAIVGDEIIAYDENDFSSQKFNKKLFTNLEKENVKFKIGFPESLENLMDEQVVSAWNRFKYLLRSVNIELIPLQLDMELINAIDPIYKIISYSEAVSCYSSFTGIPFGKHLEGQSYEEVTGKARDLLFGEQLKRRFTIGSFALKKENFDKYFLKSKLVRTKLINHFNDLLKDVDVIMSIGASSLAPLVKDVLENKKPLSNVIDDFLQISNFAGAPSITIPFAKSYKNLFLGVNFTAKQFNDDLLLKVAYEIENLINIKGIINV